MPLLPIMNISLFLVMLFPVRAVFEIFPFFLKRVMLFEAQKSSLREAHRALHPFTRTRPLSLAPVYHQNASTSFPGHMEDEIDDSKSPSGLTAPKRW
jgi:hypothetical protein